MIKLFYLSMLLFFVSGCSSGNYTHTSSTTSVSRTNVPSPIPTPSRYRQELEIVRRGNFKKQRVLNKPEESLYWKLVKYCNSKKFQVFAQISLGEILSSSADDYKYINSKRVDFCITDRNLMPIAVVEYQGSGHVNDTSEERDAVKRAAIENAKIFYIEINVGHGNQVNEILDSFFVEYS